MASKTATNYTCNFTIKKVRRIPFHVCVLFTKSFGCHFGCHFRCDFFSINSGPRAFVIVNVAQFRMEHTQPWYKVTDPVLDFVGLTFFIHWLPDSTWPGGNLMEFADQVKIRRNCLASWIQRWNTKIKVNRTKSQTWLFFSKLIKGTCKETVTEHILYY